MAIKKYQKNRSTYFRVYVQARGKTIKRIRLQKMVYGIKTLAAARREEKRLIRDLTTKVAKLEGKGLCWSEVIDLWEKAGAKGHLGGSANRYSIRDHFARIRRYTKPWMKQVASELTRGDGRRVLRWAKEQGASYALLLKLKSSINLVYTWGIEEGLIRSDQQVVNHSPVFGLSIGEKAEKTPPILTLDEVRKLLYEAKRREHPWFAHWAFAILTGMRSGELYALEWRDVDEEHGIIRVSKSYNQRSKSIKTTKNGRWRNVNISAQLKEILNYIRTHGADPQFVLHRLPNWREGLASKILRMFLKQIGIEKHVVFHTLRACFATHLLATGAEPMKVMRMGGWSDLKTFQIYIRMAGIDVKGVSDALDVLPRISGNVLSINGH
jgi:integrase